MAHEWAVSGSGYGSTDIAVTTDRVFAIVTPAGYRADEPDVNYRLLSIDRQSGDVEWTIETSSRIYQTPAVGDEVVIVAGESALMAYDVSSGREIWTLQTTLSPRTPAIINETAYTATAYDSDYDVRPRLLALDAASGEVRWEYEHDYDAKPPAVADGTVYLPSGDIHAVDAETGEQRWRHKPETQLGLTSITVGPDSVYAGLSEGYDDIPPRLRSLDPETGEPNWTFEFNGAPFYGFLPAPSVADGRVFTVGAKLYALDAVTGEVEWTREETVDRESIPTYANGALYWAYDDLVVLDPTDGSVLREQSFDPSINGRPVVLGEQVFVTPTKESDQLVRALTHRSDVTPASGSTPGSQQTERNGLSPSLIAGTLGLVGASAVSLRWVLGGSESESDDTTSEDGDEEAEPGHRERGAAALDAAKTARVEGSTEEALAELETAIAEYEAARTELSPGSDEYDAVETSLATARTHRQEVAAYHEQREEFIDALTNAETQFQTAISAYARGETGTVARLRYRQARDGYDEALSMLAEAEEDLLASEVSITPDLTTDSLPVELADLPALSSSTIETLAAEGFETLADVRQDADTLRSLAEQLDIDELELRQVTALTWRVEGALTIEERSTVETRRDAAANAHQYLL